MPVIPYVKQGAPFADTTASSGTFNAAKANAMDAGIFEAMQQAAVRVFHNTTQSINSGVETAVAFNSERFDQAGGAASTQHDTSTNNSRLTALYAGIYQITGHLFWASNGTGVRYCYIRLNGTTPISIRVEASAAVDPLGATQTSTLYSLAVNDYVELMASQNSGGALNTANNNNNSPEFMMVRVA